MIEFLRQSEPEKINQLLVLVRNATSLAEIAALVVENSLGDPLNKMTEPEAESQDDSGFGGSDVSPQQLPSLESSLPHGFLPLERLCDVPLFDIAAQPWTTVTVDSRLVSHLVSLYFTWEHPFSQIMDQKLFLQHMSAGKLDTPFCSPFLVNSLLAAASVSYGLITLSDPPSHPTDVL
jgi:hypothetical protein